MALSIRCEANYQSHKPRDIHYLWQGDQLSQQQSHYADGRIVTTQWVYEPGSFRPLAQIRQLDTVNKAGELERGKPELHYAITDMAGNVKELCDSQGQVQWRSEQGLWQALYQWRLERSPKQYLEEAILDPLHCDLRHQGQIVDEETGLYYNRHRYYDPQICQYLSPDPIGLVGGTRPQAYVHNPLEWVDPLGLSGCPESVPERGPSDATSSENLNIQLTTQEIANGHAFEKHVLKQGEFPGIRTRLQFQNHVEDVLRNSSGIRYYKDGRIVYLQESSSTVVIRNSGSGESTAFQPVNWNEYINSLPSCSTPYL